MRFFIYTEYDDVTTIEIQFYSHFQSSSEINKEYIKLLSIRYVRRLKCGIKCLIYLIHGFSMIIDY